MKNIPYEGPRLPRQVQLRRIRAVMEAELTPLQRQTLAAYYLHRQTLEQIARDRGVHRSTVCRTLHRGEEKLRRFLRY